MFSKNIQTNFWTFVAAFFSAFTIILIKYYVKTPNYFLLLVVLISELALIYSYIQLLQNGNIVLQFIFIL